MNTCKLCKTNIADKRGSHIVPHFLLKRIVNVEGSAKRDKELGFQISRLGMKSHFGRAVSPEKLEDVFGQISDKDIENNDDPLIVDYFFCTECEKRLSVIENEYAKTINKIEDKPYSSGVSSLIGLLFWSSIIWRISINGKNGVSLKAEQEEFLRCFLDNYFRNKYVLKKEFIDISDCKLSQKISYKLIRFNGCDENDSKFLLFHPECQNPLLLFIDEYVLAFAFNNNFEDFKTKKIYGVESLFQSIEESTLGKNEIIYPFSKNDYEKIHKGIIATSKNVYLKGISKLLDIIHKELEGVGETMPEEIKAEILYGLALSESKLGRKYTIDDLYKVIYVVLKKYCP